MKNQDLFSGYSALFLSDDANKIKVELPKLGTRYHEDTVQLSSPSSEVINYVNYSVVVSKSRKLPIYSASNIDAAQFKNVTRKDNFRKDERFEEFQWGKELYSALKSDFDRGHMTKREDVQWGKTAAIASAAADSTFYFSNMAPQHAQLNRVIWRSLEDYILKKESVPNKLKICVFSGPVLGKNDPLFVTKVNDVSVQIPVIFWKVVVYQKKDGKVYRVGFMMSQDSLLREKGIVEGFESELFLDFKDADTYQVNVSFIEKLTDLKLPKAIDAYTDVRSQKLILKEIDIDPELESYSDEQYLGFSIDNLKL